MLIQLYVTIWPVLIILIKAPLSLGGCSNVIDSYFNKKFITTLGLLCMYFTIGTSIPGLSHIVMIRLDMSRGNKLVCNCCYLSFKFVSNQILTFVISARFCMHHQRGKTIWSLSYFELKGGLFITYKRKWIMHFHSAIIIINK